MSAYKLFWCPGTASFAPQALMAENDIDYTLELVDVNIGDGQKPEFLTVNPAGYVPALISATGEVLYEAAACCLYLAGRHGLSDVMPGPDDGDYGIFLRSLFYLTNTVQEGCKVFYYPTRFTAGAVETDAVKVRARELLAERWKVVDDHLSAHGPHYLGARYSILDLYMTMLADWHPDRNDMLSAYPAVRENFDRVVARPKLEDVLRLHGIID